MSKTLLIIQREYYTRVRKKSFIIMTLLVPILFIGFFGIIGFISSTTVSKKNIAIVDESKLFVDKLSSDDNLVITYENKELNELTKNFSESGYDAVVHIPSFAMKDKVGAKIYSIDQLGIDLQNKIQRQLNDVLVMEKLKSAGINKDELAALQAKDVLVSNINLKDDKVSNNEASFAIGYISGMLLYFFMLFYGMNVMRSVMEEKTNRIAEIIVSSVRPFQLMLGKIIGVALVGITQFLIWVVFLLVAGAVIFKTMGLGNINPEAMNELNQASGLMAQNDFSATAASFIQSTNWLSVIGWFLFYFLGGYFLYAALFAAVGSLVNEDPQEGNQFTMPITIPIILGFVIMSSAIKEPNSALAVFGSVFPLTSPIVMMARIPYGMPPLWEMAASVILLIGGFIFTTWLAAKIYRTGILLYGKKVTIKEVVKWIGRK